jgi:hypothetical protein
VITLALQIVEHRKYYFKRNELMGALAGMRFVHPALQL